MSASGKNFAGTHYADGEDPLGPHPLSDFANRINLVGSVYGAEFEVTADKLQSIRCGGDDDDHVGHRFEDAEIAVLGGYRMNKSASTAEAGLLEMFRRDERPGFVPVKRMNRTAINAAVELAALRAAKEAARRGQRSAPSGKTARGPRAGKKNASKKSRTKKSKKASKSKKSNGASKKSKKGRRSRKSKRGGADDKPQEETVDDVDIDAPADGHRSDKVGESRDFPIKFSELDYLMLGGGESDSDSESYADDFDRLRNVDDDNSDSADDSDSANDDSDNTDDSDDETDGAELADDSGTQTHCKKPKKAKAHATDPSAPDDNIDVDQSVLDTTEPQTFGENNDDEPSLGMEDVGEPTRDGAMDITEFFN